MPDCYRPHECKDSGQDCQESGMQGKSQIQDPASVNEIADSRETYPVLLIIEREVEEKRLAPKEFLVDRPPVLSNP